MKNQGNYGSDCIPKFFKVYLPDESGDDLEIPVSFNRFLTKSSPTYVTVTSIRGKIWKMLLRKCLSDADKFVLVNGWKRIIKEEVLKAGDFLEFEFDGSNRFNFCTYESVSTCKRHLAQSQEEIKVGSDGEEETRAVDETGDLGEEDADDSEDGDYNFTNDFGNGDYAEDDGDNNGVDDDVNDDNVESLHDADDVAGDDERRYLDDPENPRFSLKNPKKTSQLLIPGRLVKDYNLRLPATVTLLDPLATKFGALERKLRIQTCGSVFVKGFGSVFRRNKVAKKDKMICEIKKRGSNNMVHTIKIHIIRG